MITFTKQYSISTTFKEDKQTKTKYMVVPLVSRLLKHRPLKLRGERTLSCCRYTCLGLTPALSWDTPPYQSALFEVPSPTALSSVLHSFCSGPNQAWSLDLPHPGSSTSSQGQNDHFIFSFFRGWRRRIIQVCYCSSSCWSGTLVMVLILLLMRFCGVETHENAAAGEASSLSPHTGTQRCFTAAWWENKPLICCLPVLNCDWLICRTPTSQQVLSLLLEKVFLTNKNCMNLILI